jgi:membrane-associated phospholipid phosphatase
MRNIVFIITAFVFLVSPVLAEEHLFNSTTAIRDEAVRLGDEALEVVKTPADTGGYGLIGTLAAAGAVGLTYLFDSDIRGKVQANKSRGLDKAADAGSLIGNPFLHLGIAAAVYGGGVMADSPKHRELGEMLGESLILADATSLLLKQAIGRGRPFTSGDKGSFRPLQFKSDYDSLPSMHAASSFAMASVMSANSETLAAKLLYYSVAAFAGYARLYKDKHWAGDIVLGAAVGELCGRVVTGYHTAKGKRSLALAPAVTGDTVSLLLLGRW